MFLIAKTAIFVILIYLLLRPMLRGAIYFPTSAKATQQTIAILSPGPGKHLADLGSGDGRLLLALVAQGATVEGFEVNPLLVWITRFRIRKAGFRDRARVHLSSFWRADLSRFDGLVVYGIPYIMRELGQKFAKELRPGTPIASNIFPIPDWTPLGHTDGVWSYRVPAR